MKRYIPVWYEYAGCQMENNPDGDWVDINEALDRIKELEHKLGLQEDYTEMLIRYMQRTHWWVNFKREYPAVTKDMECWLKERYDYLEHDR